MVDLNQKINFRGMMQAGILNLIGGFALFIGMELLIYFTNIPYKNFEALFFLIIGGYLLPSSVISWNMKFIRMEYTGKSIKQPLKIGKGTIIFFRILGLILISLAIYIYFTGNVLNTFQPLYSILPKK